MKEYLVLVEDQVTRDSSDFEDLKEPRVSLGYRVPRVQKVTEEVPSWVSWVDLELLGRRAYLAFSVTPVCLVLMDSQDRKD